MGRSNGGGSSSAAGKRTALAFCPSSRTVVAPFTGTVLARIMGAGGPGGASGSTNAASGGNGGTVAFVKVNVTAGDSIVVNIGAGGAGANGTIGSVSGATTVTGPNGLNANVPGGQRGLLASAPPANTAPTGVDQFWLGGIGGFNGQSNGCGGGSAAILEGVSAGFNGGGGDNGQNGGGGAGVGGNGSNGVSSVNVGQGGGAGGPAVGSVPGPDLLGSTSTLALPLSTDAHSRLLINVSGRGSTTYSGGPILPGGGGAGGNGGNGGRGGGGGSAAVNSSFRGGDGGSGFVVLEFVEA